MESQVENESSSGVTFHEEETSPDRLLESMKRESIERACLEGNLKQLVQLATSPGGLLDEKSRQSACMPPS